MRYTFILLLFSLFLSVHCFTSPISSPSSPRLFPTRLYRGRNCDLLGKTPNRQARVVTFSHTRNKKVQSLNLQWRRYPSADLKREVRLRLSTKGIKTVEKYGGIDRAARKFDLDLTKF